MGNIRLPVYGRWSQTRTPGYNGLWGGGMARGTFLCASATIVGGFYIRVRTLVHCKALVEHASCDAMRFP